MATLGRINCYFGRHLRSRGRARRTETGWRSHCKRCGIVMYKEDDGDWYVEAEEDEAPAANGDAGPSLDPADRHARPADDETAGPAPRRSGLGRLFGRRTRVGATVAETVDEAD